MRVSGAILPFHADVFQRNAGQVFALAAFHPYAVVTLFEPEDIAADGAFFVQKELFVHNGVFLGVGCLIGDNVLSACGLAEGQIDLLVQPQYFVDLYIFRIDIVCIAACREEQKNQREDKKQRRFFHVIFLPFSLFGLLSLVPVRIGAVVSGAGTAAAYIPFRACCLLIPPSASAVWVCHRVLRQSLHKGSGTDRT